MTRLRRSRLAGALVALGILFYPAAAGLLFQRIVWLDLICPTSLAELAASFDTMARWEDHRGTFRRSRVGKGNQLNANDKWFIEESGREFDETHAVDSPQYFRIGRNALNLYHPSCTGSAGIVFSFSRPSAVSLTAFVLLARLLTGVPFVAAVWTFEQKFEDFLQKEGRKTATRDDFVFLGIDQSTLQMPPLAPEELANNRAFQLMTERPYPWSREVWALLLDRLFGAGAKLVMFDLLFSSPNDGDPAFRAALDRYRDRVVLGANFDFSAVREEGGAAQMVPPNESLIPVPQMEDDRVWFVNFFPDPLDQKVRAARYSVTDLQLAGYAPGPGERPILLSVRAVWRRWATEKTSRAISSRTRCDSARRMPIRRGRSTKFSIRNSGDKIMEMARSLSTRSSSLALLRRSRTTWWRRRLTPRCPDLLCISRRWPPRSITNSCARLRFPLPTRSWAERVCWRGCLSRLSVGRFSVSFCSWA